MNESKTTSFIRNHFLAVMATAVLLPGLIITPLGIIGSNKQEPVIKDIKKAYELASGRDKELSREEEFNLYRELGFSSQLEEYNAFGRKNRYGLESSFLGNFVQLGIRDEYYGLLKKIEEVPASNLERYIKRKRGEGKK